MAHFAVLQLERLVGDVGRGTDARNRFVTREKAGFAHHEAGFLAHRVQIRGLLDAGIEVSGALGNLLLDALPSQRLLNLRARFVERACRGRLLVHDLDDVETELRLDEIADLPRLHGKSRLLEFGHHAPLREIIEVAAVGLRAIVFRVFLRQRGEVGARGFRLLQHVLRLLPHGSFVLAVRFQQDVARAHLLRRMELLNVRVVVALDLLRRDGHAGAQLIAVDEQVANFP